MPPALDLSVVTRVAEVPAPEWDACAGGDQPMVRHHFLQLLEDSGSATAQEGWGPAHLVARSPGGRVEAVAPTWLKGHSWGEYVFDQSWAQALQRAGGRYYPKLLVAVPFTPVPGPRLLVRPGAPEGTREALVAGLSAVAQRGKLSSVHANFLGEADRAAFAAAGWTMRMGFQFHWHNQGWPDFEAFLAALTSHRRKELRRERRQALAAGLSIRRLYAGEVSADDWTVFHALYERQVERKWGGAYLSADFFRGLRERLPEEAMLISAWDGTKLVAGALNLLGRACLYGRNWASIVEVPGLHFELCYHQAVEEALARGLARVEAGAQGEHKLQRGYLPTPTWSAHQVFDPRLAGPVRRACEAEQAQLEQVIEELAAHSPYRAEPT